VNSLDGLLIVALLLAGIGGWRLGFIGRVFAWCGVAIGLIIGIHYVPRVVTSFGGTSADDRVTVAILFLLLVATLGQAAGLALGVVAHRTPTDEGGLPRWDRAIGATIGVVGVLILVWMFIPSLATAKGWPARLARGSAIVAIIDAAAPEQPSQFAAWGRSISDAPYPSVLSPLEEPPDPGPPPQGALAADVDARVRKSILLVEGGACGQVQEGSGFVYPSPGLVITNAHVVAGENKTTVEDQARKTYDATVVAFDPVRDLAILQVDGLDAPALELGSADTGEFGAVYGHPRGGPLRAAPARVGPLITAAGTDIYRTSPSNRQVLVLAATLAPGYSGGALVDAGGKLIGVAFAIDPVHPNTSFAIADSEVRALVDEFEQSDGAPVDTRGCLVG
jgi:S1-C subfamily serine protease